MTRVEHRSAKSGGRDDWRTPECVLERVRQIDEIGLDPCASDQCQWSERFADQNFFSDFDGLAQDWSKWPHRGLTFVNWPYSQSRKWSEKVCLEASRGVPIIALCGARPGAKWYRKAVAHADAVAEWRGRLTFVGAQHSAPFPSALLAYNVSWRRFAAALNGVADVYVPHCIPEAA